MAQTLFNLVIGVDQEVQSLRKQSFVSFHPFLLLVDVVVVEPFLRDTRSFIGLKFTGVPFPLLWGLGSEVGLQLIDDVQEHESELINGLLSLLSAVIFTLEHLGFDLLPWPVQFVPIWMVEFVLLNAWVFFLPLIVESLADELRKGDKGIMVGILLHQYGIPVDVFDLYPDFDPDIDYF